MYIELIGERVLCVCFVLSTFDGDWGSKLQSRSCLSCVFFYHCEQNAFFFQMFSICSRSFFLTPV